MADEWYHATAHYGAKRRHWWNLSRDNLVSDVLVPFASGHIILAHRVGAPSLFSFSAVNYLQIFRTPDPLRAREGERDPREMSDKSFAEDRNVTAEFTGDIRVLASIEATRSVIQRALKTPKDQVFVVMKFGDEVLDSAFTGVVEPVCLEFGLPARRVDRIQDSGKIDDQVLELIADSRIVIADLSGERPNCYFEAGFAQALGKEIIFTIKSGETIHFDLAAQRFIQWRTEAELRTKLRERLASVLAKRSDSSNVSERTGDS